MEDKKEPTIIFIICALIIIITIYNGNEHQDSLKKNYAFTVGKTIEYKYDDGFKDCIEYNYFVDSVKYINCVINDSNISSSEKKFYRVKYSKVNPEISELYLTNEIKDSTLYDRIPKSLIHLIKLYGGNPKLIIKKEPF